MTGQQLEVMDAGGTVTGPQSTHDVLARLLAEVAQVDCVPLDSHFFHDLGADSLVMAHFCARVRKRPELPSVSMRDVYRHPTIRELCTALTAATPPGPAPRAPETSQPLVPSEAPPRTPRAPTGTPRYVWCGVLQLLSFLSYAFLLAFVVARGYDWIAAGTGLLDSYVRSVTFGAALLLVLCVLPVLAKWLLIGRFKPQRFRVWSLVYVRFWLVRTLIRFSPLVLFAGSPLYPLCLRALGARVGRGVTYLSRGLPVCADLLTIGDGTIVRKDSLISCYRAHDGVIETGPVTLGREAVVSEATVLDIGTRLGDGARLGHASSLHTGQCVPDGAHWHGSPAQPAEHPMPTVGPARCGTARRAAAGVLLLLTVLLAYVPVVVGLVDALLSRVLQDSAVVREAETHAAGWALYADLSAITAVVFFGAVPVALVVLATVPRLLGRLVPPGRTYPLYGFRYGVHRAIVLITNRRALTRLFGDSTCIVHYLRWIGYDLSRVEQTGSNFGTVVKHESPFTSKVGTGTMVADGLSLMNADYSSTSFRLSPTSIGAHNFLGNRIAYPSQGRTGDNCLLATKVAVPVDGPVRHDVGLLGSPCFEIPRSVLRDSSFDDLADGAGLRARLAAKNRHNAATMLCHLFTGWLYFFCVTALFAGAASMYPHWGTVVLAAANALLLPFTVLYFVLVERLLTLRQRPGPLFCSIYDRRFWYRERYWKVPTDLHLHVLDGTPFKGVVWRMLGVRMGRRVFDDGCAFTERPMVSVGDACTLNAGSVVQCHSQEDGAFKSDRSEIGARCTLGVGTLVHYGVAVGDGAELAADTFLMKGETVPEGASWAGNPARPASGTHGGER